MSSAEKKTIINVLILYLTSTLLLLAMLFYGYYHYYQEQEIVKQKVVMKEKAKEIYSQLQEVHNSFASTAKYPTFDGVQSAIYDMDKAPIYSTLKTKSITFDKEFYAHQGNLYLIYEMTPYYMGAVYIVIEQKAPSILANIDKSVIAMILVAFMLVIATSIFLVKLILKPLRDSVKLLDQFIRDTTHELNTPVATILTNIELLNKLQVEQKAQNKINRIKVGALTISNIYDDLVFLLLNHQVSSQDEVLSLNNIIQERLHYFEILFRAKYLKVALHDKSPLEVTMDKKKLIRLIDNILSNAIKYTHVDTTITLSIEKNRVTISDQGDGMSQEEIDKIFERFSRFNRSEGGFGLGYNIVYNIAKEYDIIIEIDSTIGEGTCVTLEF
ncbi:MAG: HAMP domain-containing sensor histidine kinase [Campylobacterota bacterium]|nr:HAMP domain-containing sensor histidine kinase [Campylobacterota bacterium]